MTNQIVLKARVTKRVNHIWKGTGRVISIDVERGMAILQMETGEHTGQLGGFDLTGLHFFTKLVPQTETAETI